MGSRSKVAMLVMALGLAVTASVGSARAATDPTLVTGTVSGTGSDGGGGQKQRGGTGGAEIDVFLDPAEGGGMATGDTATFTLVSSTTTDNTGAYTLTAPISSAVTAAANANGGFVNFVEVETSPSGANMSTTFFAAQLVNGSSWAVGNAASADLTVPDSSFTNSVVAPTGVIPNNGCHFPPQTTVLSTTNVQTTVGEVHTAGDMTNDFQYGRDGHAETNIGVGFSTDNVNFSASGTNYRSDTASANWPTVGAQVGQRATSSFRYQRLKVYYPCQAVTHYFKKSVQWNGGTAWGTDNHNLDNSCQGSGNTVSFLPGSGFTKIQGSGVTWSIGATFFGFNATTQQGWGTDNHSVWQFGRNNTHYYLCGNNNTPVTAQRVYAGL